MKTETVLTKAVLVKLSISQFNPHRQDAKTTREVLRNKDAAQNAGVWVKNLINPKTLDAITSTAQTARQSHYTLSLPWADEGYRILPTAIYMKYQDEQRQHRTQFNNEVEKFLQKYPQYIEEAKTALNGMFNAGDYPTIEQLKAKFAYSVEVSPLPSGSDFRISLTSDELANIQQDVDTRVKAATDEAVKDLWNRLAVPVKNMSEKLAETKGIFRDTLVSNIQEIVDLIPSLNVTDDKNLLTIANEVKANLTGHSPEVLRQNKVVRQTTAQAAQEILKKMEGYI